MSSFTTTARTVSLSACWAVLIMTILLSFNNENIYSIAFFNTLCNSCSWYPCSMSPQKLNKRSPSKQGSAHVPVWAAFGGPPPPSGDPAPLLGHNIDSQTDTTQQPLTSPRLSSQGNLEPARLHLDVEFTNMGMRLKGTGMKVLAGVTGRLRASHLTAIMGPSGAGQQPRVFKVFKSVVQVRNTGQQSRVSGFTGQQHRSAV